MAPNVINQKEVNTSERGHPSEVRGSGDHLCLRQHVHDPLQMCIRDSSMTSLSQAEMCGSPMTPFEVDLEELLQREKMRKNADASEIFERIFKGSMPAIVSGQNSNSQIFYSSYLAVSYTHLDVYKRQACFY